MEKKKRFYPSKRKNTIANVELPQEERVLDLSAPFRLQDQATNELYTKWQRRFVDEWVNPQASINSNNSIGGLSEYFINRLSYYECASLSTDTIIHKAINTIANEIFNKGGEFIILSDFEDKEGAIERLEDRLKELNFWALIKELTRKSLTYGTAFLYLSTNGDNDTLATPLNIKDFKGGNNIGNLIDNLVVVEPYMLGASEVDSMNPLNPAYMKPRSWYVGGFGAVHHTRLLQLSFFEVPNLIKPLFNYGGISLCQLMRNYVRDADNIRQSLAELFLRFRTMIIKTPMLRNNPQEVVSRGKNIAKSKNNLGLLLLSENEDYIETITPITGLDRIQSQAFENMVISSGLPATKLLGISPSGFNSTGEFDLVNYYDTISGYQNNIIKPVIIQVAQGILYNLSIDATLDFEFKPLQKLDEKQIAETKAINSTTAVNLQEAGILSSEQAFDFCKENAVIPDSFILEEETPLDLDTPPLNEPLDEPIIP